MKKEDPTIAGLLRAQGYATGQFGKNHLGDRDEMLPTNHGFDEFLGNLYHLNEVLRVPLLANLRMDPFERAEHESIGYNQWWVDHMFVFAPAGAYIGRWRQSFREFPPRQKPGSFNLDRVMETVMSQQGTGK